MTKKELGNIDALKAIKEQLENNQGKTITVGEQAVESIEEKNSK